MEEPVLRCHGLFFYWLLLPTRLLFAWWVILELWFWLYTYCK